MPVFGDDGGRREKEKLARAEGRLPPGQSLTIKWPVLHYGSVPLFDPAKWDFKISGLVENPLAMSWDEFRALPQTEVTSDFHCVTRWSRLDNHWKGVLFTEVLKRVTLKPGAEFVLVLAEEGYTSNIPLKDLQRPNVLFRLRTRWKAPRRGTRRPAPPRCATSLRLEKREVGARFHASRPRPPGLLGAQRLSRLRRPLERAALLRSVAGEPIHRFRLNLAFIVGSSKIKYNAAMPNRHSRFQ